MIAAIALASAPSGSTSAAASEAGERAGTEALSWTERQRSELRQILEGAARHGLNARLYLDLTAGASDAVLTRTAVAYARALATGLVDPRELHGIYTLPRDEIDVRSGLRVALRAGQLRAWFDTLPPRDSDYAALSGGYLRALAALDAGIVPDIPEGPALRPGAVDPRLPQIATRLQARGALAGEVDVETTLYSPTVAAAVRRLQADAGLGVDGVIGPDTLAELNMGPRDRVRQLAVNLERRRWLERRPPPTRIDVNIAAGRLRYHRDGKVAWTGRVVAGAPGHETPLLGEQFQQLVVHPPWYVPQSIATRELLPKGPAYLRGRGMYLEGGRLIQRPGPGAALGQVKFDMRNPYAIYLHDTPAKALFEASDRLRSHGCVRVEDAVGLARRLATERGRGEPFEEALASGATQVVDLGEAVPVRLLYFTAVADPDGEVRFRHDAYGWDERLADRLGLGPGRLRARLPVPADLLGP